MNGGAFELENKTLGVIGTGQIGQRHLARAFGMKVLAYDPYRQTDVTEGVRYVPLDELLRESQSSRCIRHLQRRRSIFSIATHSPNAGADWE